MQSPIQFSDLQKFDAELDQAQADDMIATAWARAQRVAPCLKEDAPELDTSDIEIVKDVLRGAILRWSERGSGAVVHRTAGDYGETLAKLDDSGNLFRPNEIRDLQSVCGSARKRGRAATISTVPPGYRGGVDTIYGVPVGEPLAFYPGEEYDDAPKAHPFLTGGEMLDEFGGF